nr:galactoside 2-alpha-L-fucosyltransferase 1-like [Penaeus vannamei]
MNRHRTVIFILLVLNLYYLYKSDVLEMFGETHALCTPAILFTSSSNGRLGNNMGEYATLWGLGRTFNVSVLLHPVMERRLRRIFPGLSMERLPASCASGWTKLDKTYKFPKNQDLFDSAAAGLLGPGKFMLGDNPVKVHLFHPFREDLLRELTFSPGLRKQARDILTKVKSKVKNQPPEITFVGVHIRRTDYINYIKKYNTTIPGKDYYTSEQWNITAKIQSPRLHHGCQMILSTARRHLNPSKTSL